MRLFSTGTIFLINTVKVPVIKPAMIPAFVVRFQKRARIYVGPVEAPSPAHAKRTNLPKDRPARKNSEIPRDEKRVSWCLCD